MQLSRCTGYWKGRSSSLLEEKKTKKSIKVVKKLNKQVEQVEQVEQIEQARLGDGGGERWWMGAKKQDAGGRGLRVLYERWSPDR